jgi:hypothetical protein
MMGMGGGEKSWAPHTDSDAYELITPYLQAKKGDVLRFYADISSGWLNLFYKVENTTNAEEISNDWTYQNTYITADSIYFIAPLSGIYQLKFTGSSVAVDDFVGFLEPMEYVNLKDNDDTQNAEAIEKVKNQKVNVYYDRVLSAEQKGYGSWTPKAYTVCLPYEFRFNEIVEPGKVKFYQLSFVDDYYKQFVFTAVADVAEAGKAYLAVVDQGEVRLNAYNVELIAEPVKDEAQTAVNDYGDWFFNENLTKVGQWTGNFKSISATEADGKNMYCLLDDGSWVRFTSADNADARLNAFRGFYLADANADTPAGARAQAPANKTVGSYHTLFSNAGVTNTGDGSIADALSIVYEADIPTPRPVTTAILPTIQTIDADGTKRYFDMQGRMLNGKPDKGLYIENGRKTVAE